MRVIIPTLRLRQLVGLNNKRTFLCNHLGTSIRSMQKSAGGQYIDEQVIEDHEELKSIYQQYKTSGEMKFYNQFVYELCRHAVGEELILYPLIEGLGPTGKALADQSRKDHHHMKEVLQKMESMTKGPKIAFDKEFDTLFVDLQTHMQMEESDDLKLVRDLVSAEDRVTYGKKFQNRKAIAPTRPHPSAPEKPVLLEEAMGLMLAPLDKFRDLFRQF